MEPSSGILKRIVPLAACRASASAGSITGRCGHQRVELEHAAPGGLALRRSGVQTHYGVIDQLLAVVLVDIAPQDWR